MIALSDGKRHSIFDDERISADKCFVPNAAKLMNAGKPSDGRSVAYFYVARKCCRVYHKDLIP